MCASSLRALLLLLFLCSPPRVYPWFLGCFSPGSSLSAAPGGSDLDPVACSALCLDEGFQFAALSPHVCYCGDQQHGFGAQRECPNMSCSGGTEDGKGGHRVFSLPVGGGGRGLVAVYSSAGPYLHSVHVSSSAPRLQAGQSFTVEVSGRLAGRLPQSTEIPCLKDGDFSYVTVEVQETTRKGQSSHRVSVLDDGSFVVSSRWILETPGKYELNVSVSNPLSRLSFSLHLLVLQPSPPSLLLSVRPGPRGLPPCLPSPPAACHSGRVEAVYLSNPVPLQADMGDGLAAEFCWCFHLEEKEEKCVRSVCPPSSDCGSSAAVVVVRLAVSDLRLNTSDSELKAGELVPVDLELFTTLNHLLIDTKACSSSISTGETEGLGENSSAENRSHRMTQPEDQSCNNSSEHSQSHGNIHNSDPAHLRDTISFRIPAGSNVSVSLLVNGSLLHRNSSDSAAGEHSAVVFLLHHTGAAVVELRAPNRASSQNKSTWVCVERKEKPSPHVRVNPTWQPPTSPRPVHSPGHNVSIYTAKRAYPTNTDVTFLAVAEAPDPVEFLWHFGDQKTARTSSRTVTKRYHRPGSYDVFVVLWRGGTALTSAVLPLVVQRAVQLNRLLHRASVQQNQTVTLTCRVTVGTDVSFLWSFGDGSLRWGQSTEQHVYHRTGEFRVTVTVWNLVSSASLSSSIFVVDRPCQPPPVKNMGPLRLQVRRQEILRLGVTYETDLDCDISEGLHYTWTLVDSAGRLFSLPLVDTHRQSLVLPAHLLHYGTYTAIARVQVVGSVVYSNYSVKVQVVSSPPVALIQGGTNIFINNRKSSIVSLDGQRSYDPDAESPLSFSWTCKPVSSIPSSCFHRDVPTSSPELVFPASLLKHNFDQFRFTLTVRSGERAASAEVFLTITSHVIGNVSVHCPQCQGELLNWDQPFSVSASFGGCDVAPKDVQYTWSLHTVNASSRPVIEVPFCHTVDLGAPSSMVQGSATSSPDTPGISSLHPPASDASQHSPAVTTLAPASPAEDVSESRAEELNANGTENTSSVLGEEAFYHPPGEFDPPQPLYSSTEYQPLALDNRGVLDSELLGRSDIISEIPVDLDSSADWDFSFPVFGSGEELDLEYDPLMSAKEGDPGVSAGRPTGLEGESFGPGQDPGFHLESQEDESSNLMSESRPSAVSREPNLLDLSREPVHSDLFESYTYTGVFSHLLLVRPFSLRPGSRYMLEVAARAGGRLVGRTQLFLKTKPAPTGVTCQVQPMEGMELHTQFSIFCTSGREDLVYKYSISVGDKPPRTLYQGRDFQYYFNLPSGDPTDDYKVTISTEIRSSSYGAATKPCPVTVRVQPSFFRETSCSSSSTSSSSSSCLHPDVELSESGLRNLSSLVQLGNSAEIRNYVSLLTGILNRLSLDTLAQRRTRNALMCTMCELESTDQASLEDNICLLKNLLQVTSQVAIESARRVTRHVQVISGHFSKPGAAVWLHLDQRTLSSLVALLSHSLNALVTGNELTLDTPSSAGIQQAVASHPHSESIRNTKTRQTVRLVHDILQVASDLMLKYLLFHKVQEHRVSTGFISLYARHLKQSSTVLSSGSATFYMPVSLLQRLFPSHGAETVKAPCVLSLLTELSLSPYPQVQHPKEPSGPVVDLSLYECGTRRKIPIRSLVEPINIELEQVVGNMSCGHDYMLGRSQVHYHSFNITQEHSQQAIQLTVVFTPPPSKAFPIMLLFRMFERPTPTVHHLQRIHRWGGNSTQLTLPPSHLRAAGVGHVALLNADWQKTARYKHLSEQVSYSLSVQSSWCSSWDDQQGAWTPRGCRTHLGATAVSCSCHQLRPVTVQQQQIQSSYDTAGVDRFISAHSDLTVLGVLVLCVCLYIPVLVTCKRADVLSQVNWRVHFLSDNSPWDPHLYAVTIHTGLHSAASMSAKVYIVLYGEDASSQTRELHVPGCTLFRRNSQDTFIVSAAESLGALWGVHIWHDNSGPSPSWFLKHVEVSEVSSTCLREPFHKSQGRDWLFIGQCWLAVDQDDGRVEKTLQVSTQGVSFAEMLRSKVSDYLSEHHIWMSVHSCPCPTTFSRTQRLGVTLLLLLGYACVNAAIISQMDDQQPLQSGITDVSAGSVRTGVLSVFAVLPAAALLSFLFRLCEVEATGSGVQFVRGKKSKEDFTEETLAGSGGISEPHLSWSSLQQWAQEAWRKKHQGAVLLPASATTLENKNTEKEAEIQADVVTGKDSDMGPAFQNVLLITEVDRAPRGKECERAVWSGPRDVGRVSSKEGEDHRSRYCVTSRLRGSQWCQCLAWTLCLLSSLCCLLLSAVLGTRFSNSKILMWLHSLFFSLTSCIFFIQPAVLFTVAAAVSLWYRNRADFHSFTRIKEFTSKTPQPTWPEFPPECCPHLEQLLEARQRARFLRLVRPLTPAELRKSRGKKRRATLLRNTLRNLSVCACMLFLMLCINYGCSLTDRYHLNKAVRKQFTSGSHHKAFTSIKTQEDWWTWAETSLLNLLYKNISGTTDQSHILLGEPILWKMEGSSEGQLSGVTLVPEGLRSFLTGSETSTPAQSSLGVPMATPPRTCGQFGCYSGPSATAGLGHTKSEAMSQLRLLRSGVWLDRRTEAVRLQFTLFSPAPNLFTSVTMLAEQSSTGMLLPSATVQSVRVYHSPAVWHYAVMLCQLLFFLLSLLQLCDQVQAVSQQGLMGYWRTPHNWLEVTLLAVTFVHCIYYISCSVMVLEVVELLQRHSHRGHVDVGALAAWEQSIRTLRGIIIFLLIMKCVVVLRATRTFAAAVTLLARSLSSLVWPAISCLILLVVLSCVGNLLFGQSSRGFSSTSRSLQTLLSHWWDLRAVGGLYLSSCGFLYRVALYLSSNVLRTAMVIGVMSSLVRSAKRCRSRGNVFTTAELMGYIRHRLSSLFTDFTGLHRQAKTGNHAEEKTYYLEEFENLVDELLFRLNALSNSLHHTLPPKASRYMEEGEEEEEGQEDNSPAMSPCCMATQECLSTQRTQQTAVSDHTDASGLTERMPASRLLWPKHDREILQLILQRGLTADNSSLDDPQQSATKPKESSKPRELQGRDHLSLPVPAALMRPGTQDVVERQSDLWTKTSGSCSLSRSQATHTEVVVEVLVHEDPACVEPDTVGDSSGWNVTKSFKTT